MRRKEREVTDFTQIAAVMDQCDACRLGILDEKQVPYIVPLCFGYDGQADHLTLYFHSAGEGRKLDLIRQNNVVAFEMDTNHALFQVDETTACHCGMYYQSVMGTGTARLVEDADEKLHAFQCIMAHYTDKQLPFLPQPLKAAAIIAVSVDSLSCKVNNPK